MKLRDFQYRLLHKKIPTNKELKLWGIKNTNTCAYCNVIQSDIISGQAYKVCWISSISLQYTHVFVFLMPHNFNSLLVGIFLCNSLCIKKFLLIRN